MPKNIIALLVASACLFSFDIIDYYCTNLPANLQNYAQIIFPTDIINNQADMDNMPANNPITDAGATLGRVLFYDVALSKNYSISCSSCHRQEFSFTDTARFSVGFNGQLTRRNSMGLAHARFQKDSAFFWDNRATTLEMQVLMPIHSSVEMGLSLDSLVNRLKTKAIYPPLFQVAFGSADIDTTRIARAIAQFIRSMNTFGSKYRQGITLTNGNPETTPFVNFTAEENLGKNLFMDIRRGNCQACHTRNIFVPQGSKNIGLDLEYADNGVGEFFNNGTKDGQFSVPSLINIELTAPYMHDGRYQTLEQVINFYSDSIKPHRNLDGFLREIIPGNPIPNNDPCETCPPRKIQYTATEKKALLAFLKTLTDTILIKDPRWSDPFCRTTSTGIRELTPVLTASVFPNPIQTSAPVTVRMINKQKFNGWVVIMNAEGRRVYQRNEIFQAGQYNFSVPNVFQLPGIYLLKIYTTKTEAVVLKLISVANN
jgi:cytochrome c peroxidase